MIGESVVIWCETVMPLKPLICANAILLSVLAPSSHATDRPANAEKGIDPIEQLVARLGSDDFTERRGAEAELLQLGAAAFDYLQAAQSDPDLEIATQSQYLLYRVPIDWVRSEDPAEVREHMTNYAGVNQRERRDIITQLAKLDDGAGLAALSRIAHYDMSTITAKYAAIGALNGHVAHAESARDAAQAINQEIGDSPRDSVRWLRLYATQLKHLDQVDSAWPALIVDEAALLEGEDRSTSARLVLGLIQFHLNLSQSLGDDKALFNALKGKVSFLNSQAQTSDANAVRVISRMLDKHDTSVLESSTSGYSRWIEHDALLAYVLTSQREAMCSNLALTLAWVLDNHEWGVLPLLEKHYEKEIKGDRLLLYMIAATHGAAEHPDEASEIANRAFDLIASDRSERNQLGEVVAELGHHDWAEQEWQYVIDKHPTIDIESMKARRSIANWCLHDRGEDKAAADLLGEVCDAVDNRRKKLAEEQEAPNFDVDVAILDETGRFYVNALKIQREYFLACHLESQGDIAGQQKHLETAFRLDQQDPDVLIAMFRLKEADDVYREKVAGRIRRAIDQVEQRIESDPEEPQWYNHYAWLVSNTQGDFDKAVRYSLKSLELCPNTPSYLDTLGRCYYAAGDLKNAIKVQRQAVAMHPKVQVMRRQLEMFEQALAENNK
jgi:tetratricopeptide (TPR) repeat protein